MKNLIENIFRYILIFIAIFTICYLAMSFVNLTFNIHNWKESSRLIIFIISGILILGIIIKDYLDT